MPQTVERSQKAGEVQTIEVHARATATMRGVTDVLRFEDTIAVFSTVQGTLSVEGENLRMVRLSPEHGEVDLAGKLNGFYYDEVPVAGSGFWHRLFGR